MPIKLAVPLLEFTSDLPHPLHFKLVHSLILAAIDLSQPFAKSASTVQSAPINLTAKVASTRKAAQTA